MSLIKHSWNSVVSIISYVTISQINTTGMSYLKTLQFSLDGWTEHLVIPFAKRPTNAQESGGCFINTFQIFYPDMFRHMVAILRGSWMPDKILKQCCVIDVCGLWPVPCGQLSLTTGHTGNHTPKHVEVESFLEHLLVFLQTRPKFSLGVSSCGPLPTSNQHIYLPHIRHKLILLSGRTWKRPSNIFLGQCEAQSLSNKPTPLTLLTYSKTSAGWCSDTSFFPSPFQRWQYPHVRQMLHFTCVATVTWLYTDTWPAKHFHFEFAGCGLNEPLVIPSGVPRIFFRGWGWGSTNPFEARGQREPGSGGRCPLVRSCAQFANEWNPYSY
jgi:hypothetical protein